MEDWLDVVNSAEGEYSLAGTISSEELERLREHVLATDSSLFSKRLVAVLELLLEDADSDSIMLEALLRESE